MPNRKTIPTLHSERLLLRPMTVADAEPLFAMFSDAETVRFMPTLPHRDVDETYAHLERELSIAGSINWAICLRESDILLGHLNYLGQTLLPGMGYILRRDRWGQGLVTEACRAALDYGFKVRELDRVELWINEQNFASQRVAQKLGFRLKGNLPQKYKHETKHHMMLVYGMWATEWLAQTTIEQGVTFYNAQPVLLVHDVATSVDFFQKKLGFRIDFLFGDPPNHAGVSRGDWNGQMVSLQLSQVSLERELIPSGYIYILVGSNIDDLFDEYQAKGVDIVNAPTSQPWGMREFELRELNGHVLRFGTHVVEELNSGSLLTDDG